MFTRKRDLHEHTIRKHPHLIATITSKLHKCTYCAYQTVLKPNFDRHLLTHPETVNNYKFQICVRCNAKFRNKSSLDDHTVKKHPDFVASVSRKLYECTQCTFKTVTKAYLDRHMSKHSADSHNLSLCIHCNVTFKSKKSLDEHTVRKHLDLVESLSVKVYKCAHCSYKTTLKTSLHRHMSQHPETEGGSNLIICGHCNITFKSKQTLDDHTIRTHPDFIASVSGKIHECTYCTYKTTVMKSNLARHMLKHPELADSDNLSRCIHCKATYKSKTNLDDHTLKQHPDFIATVSSKLHKCTYCTYQTTIKFRLTQHLNKHAKTKLSSYNLSMCVHCNATYKSKRKLDEHVVRKHPNYIASISRKMHECIYCTYKSTMSSSFAKHMLKHPETMNEHMLIHTERANKFNICVHCNAKFKSKASVDDHTIREHPDLIATISSKIHECRYCTYKTTKKSHWTQHLMLTHLETGNNYKFNICVHCNAKFKRKASLDDHTLRKHPDFMASVSCKVYECAHCTYKTVMKATLVRHMVKHPEKALNYNFSICVHCNAAYNSKPKLDEHIVRKHPNSIASITSKMYECIYCTYKSTLRSSFAKHMLKHSETVNNYKFKICVHCNLKYKHKFSLDDHTLRKHPDLIATISSKIHECTYCNVRYKSKQKLDNHIISKHPNSMASISSKIHECKLCTSDLDRHMLKHSKSAGSYNLSNAKHRSKQSLDEHVIRKHPNFISSITSKLHQCTYCTYKSTLRTSFAKHMLKHPETVNNYKFQICVYCNAKHKSKRSLDEHVIRQHPNFISSITSKLHQCTYCTYKSTLRNSFAKHMLKHPEAVNNYKFQICVHCNAQLKGKRSLDEHVIRKHPDSVASITSKMYECTYCTYKSTQSTYFAKHMLKHPEAANNYKFQICVHCNLKHKSKRSLDEHVIRKHPDSVASITSKIHECTYCTYKSTLRNSFAKHTLKHPETANNYKFQICVHCNAKHKSKRSLDEHVIRKHPNSVASITSKIHECTYCTYKSTVSTSLAKHMLKHPEAVNNCKFQICVHCNAKFKNKISLDNHTIRYHPNFVAAVTSKVHECPCCTYKTTLKGNLHKHMLIHPEAVNNYKFQICIHCNAKFKNKISLDNHTIRYHPNFVASVTRKVHECPCCTYKTTLKGNLHKHMLIHPEAVNVVHTKLQ
nr:unnamed protein product [Callosobruchus analis]